MLPPRSKTIIARYTSVSKARAPPPLWTSHRSSSSSSMSTSTKRILCSQGEDEAKLTSEAMALTTDDGKWRLIESGKGFERTFRFKTFKATWDFMNTVAAECKAQKHHPEWSNVYTKTQIRWTTHRPDGLSSKDVHMARFCDRAGAEHGELPLVGEGGQEGGRG